jgi:hypothetical protein
LNAYLCNWPTVCQLRSCELLVRFDFQRSLDSMFTIFSEARIAAIAVPGDLPTVTMIVILSSVLVGLAAAWARFAGSCGRATVQNQDS